MSVSKKKLSGYDVIEIINSGGFGDVYKARKKDSGEVFAVKVMPKKRRTAAMTVAQQREVDIMKSLHNAHPNIINLLGWRDTAFNVQLFMPLYPMTLAQHIRNAPVPEDQAEAISLQMCSAAVHLQQHRILHRDIKPANILMKCQPLAAVLSDFGCSREVLRGQPLTRNMVTLWYRAPEILLEGSTYDLPSDVWSLGITLVEVEKGDAPFQHSSEMSMLSDILQTLGCTDNTSSSLFRGIPKKPGSRRWGHRYGKQFQNLIDAMLVVLPEQRISAYEASRHTFFDLAQPWVVAN